jgi:hypothetical protein
LLLSQDGNEDPTGGLRKIIHLTPLMSVIAFCNRIRKPVDRKVVLKA